MKVVLSTGKGLSIFETTRSNFVQLSKAFLPIDVIVWGKTIDLRLSQPPKDVFPIELTELGMVIDVMLEQHPKTPSSIELRELDKLSDDNEVHP